MSMWFRSVVLLSVGPSSTCPNHGYSFSVLIDLVENEPSCKLYRIFAGNSVYIVGLILLDLFEDYSRQSHLQRHLNLRGPAHKLQLNLTPATFSISTCKFPSSPPLP